MKLTLLTNKNDFYKKYYQAINGILKLTNKELSILETLSTLKAKGYTDKELFSSKTRSKIANDLGMSKFNFNNYIKTMADRNILIRNGRKLSINNSIYVDISNSSSIEFLIKLNIHE